MRFGSVCSGIEAASVAWHPLGWQAEFFSEIEAFPSALLAHRYPHVPNHGDMTKFQEWPDHAIDLLVGGTPCQSFSVAGLRKGLADPRGNLALTYLAIADRYRPEWLVWENVPGVLSSDGGRDFGAFLGGLGELGYGFAYRVLDAQFVRVDGFGRAVPQRRRRVFVVGCLGDWRRAAAVLFERESLSWHSAPRREAGQGTAADVVSSLTASGREVERPGETRGQDPVMAVAFDLVQMTSKANRSTLQPVSPTMAKESALHAVKGWAVRRLTPTECERLQGFPDGYTAIPYRNKPAADGPRYKALGNSMACNVMRWIGRRIELVNSAILATRRAA
jgi:DNA (cytosine-5)-methyltransferase 1